MREVAHGLNIYYKNQKDFRNTVFFSDGKYKYYDDGTMLFEIICDDARYMLIEKVENMIKAFPNKQEMVTRDGIADCFKWLYGTVESDKMPVATEIFRSSFNDAIQQVVTEMKSTGDYVTIEDFFMACYMVYMEQVKVFFMIVQAIVTSTSLSSDEFQKEIAEVFLSSVDDLYKAYTKKCSVQHKDGLVVVSTVCITNFLQLLTFEYCRLKKSGKIIKACANCGRLFIPQRADAIYCQYPAPEYNGKTCKEIGPQVERQKKRQNDPKEHEHHNTVCRYHNAVRRANKRGENDTVSYVKRLIDDEMKKYASEKER